LRRPASSFSIPLSPGASPESAILPHGLPRVARRAEADEVLLAVVSPARSRDHVLDVLAGSRASFRLVVAAIEPASAYRVPGEDHEPEPAPAPAVSAPGRRLTALIVPQMIRRPVALAVAGINQRPASWASAWALRTHRHGAPRPA